MGPEQDHYYKDCYFPASMLEYMNTVHGRPGRPATAMFQEAVDRCELKFQSMKPSLDRIQNADSCKSILDVGCGFAVADIFLAKYLGLSEIHLLDGDGTARRQKGFNEASEPWGNVHIAGDIVRANAPAAVVYAHCPPLNLSKCVDMVVSLRSWGHHYPISTYLKDVQGWLRPKGWLIIDIRKPEKTKGVEQLQAVGFQVVEQIPDSSDKCKRYLFRKLCA